MDTLDGWGSEEQEESVGTGYAGEDEEANMGAGNEIGVDVPVGAGDELRYEVFVETGDDSRYDVALGTGEESRYEVSVDTEDEARSEMPVWTGYEAEEQGLLSASPVSNFPRSDPFEVIEMGTREEFTADNGGTVVDHVMFLEQEEEDGMISERHSHTPIVDNARVELNLDEGRAHGLDNEFFISYSGETVDPLLIQTERNEVNSHNTLKEDEEKEDQAVKDLLLLKAINAKYLPAFANEENVILHDTILEAELALKKAEEAVEEQDDRAAIMEEHMKRVQQEIYFSQSRHEAKRREIATEQHLWKISDFESSRLKGQ